MVTVSCGDGSNASSSGGGGGGGKQQTIALGSPLALSGPAAFVGTSAKQAIEVARDMINADPTKWIGGNRKLDFRVSDIGSDATQTLTAARSIISDTSVKAILGTSVSTQAFPLGPFMQSSKVPLIVPTADAAGVTDAGNYVFQVPIAGEYVVAPLADLAEKILKVKSIGIVYTSDNQANVGQMEIGKKLFTERGMTVTVAPILFTDSNFSTSISKLKAANVEAVFLPMPQVASFQTQAAQAGFKPQFLGSPTMGSESNLKNAGAAAEGEILATDYTAEQDTPLNKQFVDEYNKRFGVRPDVYAGETYSAVLVLASALKSIQGEVTRDGIRDALEKGKDIEVVVGDGKFTFRDRRATFPAVLMTVKSGKFVPYKPAS